MKIFNLYGDEWDEARDREGWRIREAFVGHHIGGEPIMLARPGPTAEYWEGEE